MIEVFRTVEGFGIEKAVSDGDIGQGNCLIRCFHVVVISVAQEQPNRIVVLICEGFSDKLEVVARKTQLLTDLGYS